MITEQFTFLIIIVVLGFSMLLAQGEDKMPYWIAVFVGVITISVLSFLILVLVTVFGPGFLTTS